MEENGWLKSIYEAPKVMPEPGHGRPMHDIIPAGLYLAPEKETARREQVGNLLFEMEELLPLEQRPSPPRYKGKVNCSEPHFASPVVFGRTWKTKGKRLRFMKKRSSY